MAKKTQVLQLQTEVNNDEDWEKLLQRDGLIVVDIYSEWCGPCTGMTATLKKLKLEIGGDLLQLAIAKADKITALERFRNKSEPTWMFIVNGKMVNFMFGANAPKLTKLIIDELKKEQDAREGKRSRAQMEIDELAEEERERQAVIENLMRIAKEKELAKAAKDLYDRRVAECNSILENLNHFGVILIFPHARTTYHDAFGDLLGEAGLTISQAEKITLEAQQLEDLFYFSENPFPEDAIQELLEETSVVLLIKPIPARDVEEPTDDLIQEIVYGRSKKPPGDENSPARVLERIEEGVEGEPVKVTERVGIWVPMSSFEKATALRLFYHRQTEHYLIAEPEPEPPHYAFVFEAYRRHELAELMNKYRDEILRFGFFTSEVPEDAQLVGKSVRQYERQRANQPLAEDKLVIQLSKKKSECILAFVSMKPQYVSPNAYEGKRECQIFFPEEYDEPPSEEDEEAEEGTEDTTERQEEVVLDESRIEEYLITDAGEDEEETEVGTLTPETPHEPPSEETTSPGSPPDSPTDAQNVPPAEEIGGAPKSSSKDELPQGDASPQPNAPDTALSEQASANEVRDE